MYKLVIILQLLYKVMSLLLLLQNLKAKNVFCAKLLKILKKMAMMLQIDDAVVLAMPLKYKNYFEFILAKSTNIVVCCTIQCVQDTRHFQLFLLI